MADIPSTFKAAVLPTPKGKHVVDERSLGPLGPGEVAIRVTATAINPVDWKIRDQGILYTKYPAVLGSDAAGEIAALGSGVSSFSKGDRVFFQGILTSPDNCTFQQYCKLPAELVSHTPSIISDEQAAGVQLALMAAVTGFYHNTGHGISPGPWDVENGGREAGKGKAIIILGGSSSVGQYAIQLARLSGYERIVTNSSASHANHLKSLGAHVVLDRKTQSKPEDYREALGDVPLDFVWDSIAEKETAKLGIAILGLVRTTSKDRQVVGVWNPNDNPDPTAGPYPEVVEAGLAANPKVNVKQILGLGSAPEKRYVSEPVVKAIGGEDGWIAKGLFQPNRPIVIEGGLGGLDQALDRNKAGVSGEKVVIRPFGP
ncbi:TOXD [Diaporthe helianthi]|uniref:TOXD n=1 Tax=Diaporthe helianthi TaxID=158607 RepID=A0A2P5HKN4_DIAHE|nr:TOXD [Diaporthe helianthi]